MVPAVVRRGGGGAPRQPPRVGHAHTASGFPSPRTRTGRARTTTRQACRGWGRAAAQCARSVVGVVGQDGGGGSHFCCFFCQCGPLQSSCCPCGYRTPCQSHLSWSGGALALSVSALQPRYSEGAARRYAPRQRPVTAPVYPSPPAPVAPGQTSRGQQRASVNHPPPCHLRGPVTCTYIGSCTDQISAAALRHDPLLALARPLAAQRHPPPHPPV